MKYVYYTFMSCLLALTLEDSCLASMFTVYPNFPENLKLKVIGYAQFGVKRKMKTEVLKYPSEEPIDKKIDYSGMLNWLKEEAKKNPQNHKLSYFYVVAAFEGDDRRIPGATCDIVDITAMTDVDTINGELYAIRVDGEGNDKKLVCKKINIHEK